MGTFTNTPESFRDHVRTIAAGENIIIARDGRRVELDKDSAGLALDALTEFARSEG